MKRRSIFAAVAMLVVSAIVLSSATYAWFAASSSATVTGLTATVANTNSAIEVSGDNGSSWGSTLDFSSAAFTAKTVSTTLTPVDYVKPTSGTEVKFVSCSMNGTTITYSSANVSAGSGYSVYTLKLRNLSTDAATITATPTGGSNSGEFNFGINYGYILFNISAKADATDASPTVAQYIYGTGGYTSLVSDASLVSKTATSSNNTVVDSSDTGDLVAGLGNEVTSGSLKTGAMTFTLGGSEIAEITMYVWAEGQDVDCTGAFGNTGAITGGIQFDAS